MIQRKRKKKKNARIQEEEKEEKEAIGVLALALDHMIARKDEKEEKKRKTELEEGKVAPNLAPETGDDHERAGPGREIDPEIVVGARLLPIPVVQGPDPVIGGGEETRIVLEPLPMWTITLSYLLFVPFYCKKIFY